MQFINNSYMPKQNHALSIRNSNNEVLTNKQAEFCKEWIRNGGNGTKAVLNTYKANSENVAGVIAHTQLRKEKIQLYIRDILSLEVMNDNKIDLELSKVIVQNSELNAKNKAIDTYNRLGGRYEKDNRQSAITVNLIRL